MSVYLTLSCTCGDGGQASGNRQEIIEKRMAPEFGLTVREVHALIDLQITVLDEVLDKPDEFEEFRTERMIAERSGRPLEWVKDFLARWEYISADLDGTKWWLSPEVTK